MGTVKCNLSCGIFLVPKRVSAAKFVTEQQAGLLYLALSVSQISVVESSLVLLPLKMWATKGEKKGKKPQSVLQSDK